MYAPKFRSWMSDWDRFDETLAYRLDKMAEEAKREIRESVAAAMPKASEPEVPPFWINNISAILQNQYFPTTEQSQRQIAAAQNVYPQRHNLGPYYGPTPIDFIGSLFGPPR